MEFHVFKQHVIAATGLEKDALHIYVGIGVYLLTLALSRPLFRHSNAPKYIALIAATSIALLGEYLDIRYNLRTNTKVAWGDSIHDLLNTCFWPYMLFALSKWTTLLQSPRH